MKSALLVALFLAMPVYAEPPTTPAPWSFPPLPTSEPPLMPAPTPSPDTVLKLSPEETYVSEFSESCFYLVSPPGVVSVVQDKGPIKIRSRFYGGSGKLETRTFAGPAVFSVEAVAPGKAELLVVKVGAKGPEDVARRTIEVTGPRPPPVPPTPPPDPSLPIEGKRVLMIWDDTKALPTGQHSIIYGKQVRDYLERKATDFVIWPSSTAVEDGYKYSKEFGDAFKKYKTGGFPLPWLVVGNGTTGKSMALPANPAEAMTVFKQYFGE